MSSTIPIPRLWAQPGTASAMTANAISGGRAVASKTPTRRSDGRPPLAKALFPVRRRHQAIHDAALGEQDATSALIGLELSAQAADGHPHIGRIGPVRFRPDPAEQAVGRDRAVHLAQEHVE